MERTILELYEIVLNSFANGERYLYICNCAERYLLSADYERFIEHFYTQRPSETQYVEFFNHRDYIGGNQNRDSWFSYRGMTREQMFGSETFNLRVELLKAIIENLKK